MHHITLTHCEPERAVGAAASGNPNFGSFHCFACGKSGTFLISFQDPETTSPPDPAERPEPIDPGK